MVRKSCRSLIVASLCLLVADTAASRAQPVTTKLDAEFERFIRKPAEPGEARSRIITLRDSGLTTPSTPADKAALDAMSQYFVYRITDPKYHAPAEPATAMELKPRQPSQFVTQLFSEVRGYIHPLPGTDTTGWDPGRRAYAAEFGASLDKSITEILLDPKNPPAILREAATRMLVVACESGAPAHWVTVLALLSNPKIEPEVAYFALKAAENLFGAYDLKRGWVHDVKGALKPWVEPKIYVDLVLAVEKFALKPPPFLHRVADSTHKPGEAVNPATLTPGEVAVVRFYRVQALRALGQLKQDTIGGKATEEIRPIYTLARFALSDPTIVPAPSSKEYAEAVIGLCHVQPGTELLIEDVAIAVANGLKGFGLPRSGAVEEDKTVLWKTTAERFRMAMKNWNENVAKVARFGAKQKDPVNTLVDAAMIGVIDPLGKPAAGVGGRLDLTKIDGWLTKYKPATPDIALFKDSTVKVALPK